MFFSVFFQVSKGVFFFLVLIFLSSFASFYPQEGLFVNQRWTRKMRWELLVKVFPWFRAFLYTHQVLACVKKCFFLPTASFHKV